MREGNREKGKEERKGCTKGREREREIDENRLSLCGGNKGTNLGSKREKGMRERKRGSKGIEENA